MMGYAFGDDYTKALNSARQCVRTKGSPFFVPDKGRREEAFLALLYKAQHQVHAMLQTPQVWAAVEALGDALHQRKIIRYAAAIEIVDRAAFPMEDEEDL